eukprot:11738467-Alexandrium_andersonii.AAC.1
MFIGSAGNSVVCNIICCEPLNSQWNSVVCSRICCKPLNSHRNHANPSQMPAFTPDLDARAHPAHKLR